MIAAASWVHRRPPPRRKPPPPPRRGGTNGSNGDDDGDDNGTRARQILNHFKVFHFKNPIVWELVQEGGWEAIRKGFKHYSISVIIEGIRWHKRVKTESGDGLKICNDYRAYYARMFHVAYPEHRGFFRNRIRRSLRRPAFEGDPPPTIDPLAGPDDDLDSELRGLI